MELSKIVVEESKRNLSSMEWKRTEVS